jgi:hypothetical protein
MLNIVPPITSLNVVAAMSTDAATVPAAVKTWIFPDLPSEGAAGNVILSGGSGHIR